MQRRCVNKYSFRPDQTHRCTPVGIMLDYPVSSTSSVTEVSRTVRPADMHIRAERIYSCNECERKYTQRQGVTRHQREAHGKKNLCPMGCNDFRWIRRYHLEKHLKEQHLGIDLEPILLEATRRCREATLNRKHLRQQQASHTIECDRKSHGKPLPCSPKHTVVKDSHVSLCATLPMVYDPHLEHHAERPVTSCKREDAREPHLFDGTTHSPFAPSSAEERFQPVNDSDMSVQHGQDWSAYPSYGCRMTSNP